MSWLPGLLDGDSLHIPDHPEARCLETLVREVGIRVRTHISGIRLLVNPLDHSDIRTPGSYKQNYLTFENIPQYDRLLFNFKSVALQFYSHREQVYK